MDEKAGCTPPPGGSKDLEKIFKNVDLRAVYGFVNFVSQNGSKHQARVDCIAFWGLGFQKHDAMVLFFGIVVISKWKKLIFHCKFEAFFLCF